MPDAGFVWQLILTLALIAGIGANIAVITSIKRTQRASVGPQPFVVQAAQEFITKKECEKHHASIETQLAFLNGQRVTDAKDAAGSRKGIYTELEGVRKEMVEMERRINKADEDRTTGLHNRLNEILSEVSEVRGAMNAQSKPS